MFLSPKFRVQIIVAAGIILTLLGGCGGSKSVTGETTYNPGASLVAQLEAVDAIPVLDTSQSLEGLDNDQNGIRDDIDSYILTLQLADQQKDRLGEFAKVLQKIQISNLNSPEIIEAIGFEMARSIYCFGFTFENDILEFSTHIKRLQAYTANTRNRTYRYIEYNTRRNGAVLEPTAEESCTA